MKSKPNSNLVAYITPVALKYDQRPRKVFKSGANHGERGARAYNGGLRVEPPAGSRGRAPGQGQGVQSPLKLKHF